MSPVRTRSPASQKGPVLQGLSYFERSVDRVVSQGRSTLPDDHAGALTCPTHARVRTSGGPAISWALAEPTDLPTAMSATPGAWPTVRTDGAEPRIGGYASYTAYAKWRGTKSNPSVDTPSPRPASPRRGADASSTCGVRGPASSAPPGTAPPGTRGRRRLTFVDERPKITDLSLEAAGTSAAPLMITLARRTRSRCPKEPEATYPLVIEHSAVSRRSTASTSPELNHTSCEGCCARRLATSRHRSGDPLSGGSRPVPAGPRRSRPDEVGGAGPSAQVPEPEVVPRRGVERGDWSRSGCGRLGGHATSGQVRRRSRSRRGR